MFLKNGKYGLYVIWGEKSQNLKDINKDEEDITLEDVIEYLTTQKSTESYSKNKQSNKTATTNSSTSSTNSTSSNIIRILNENLSIRNGKYGDYIYYKTKAMLKPKFLDLKKYEDDYREGDIKKFLKLKFLWRLRNLNAL